MKVELKVTTNSLKKNQGCLDSHPKNKEGEVVEKIFEEKKISYKTLRINIITQKKFQEMKINQLQCLTAECQTNSWPPISKIHVKQIYIF